MAPREKLMTRLNRILIAAAIVLAAAGCKPQQKYIVQICTGGWNNRNYTTEEIIQRLETVTGMIPVEKVIIGWNLGQEPYREIGEYLHSKDIRMILWLPVFSEIGHLEPAIQSIDIWGRQTESYNLQEGEDFTFYCPSAPENIAAVESIYEKYFEGCGFDGVFMDKIRTASYVAGLSGVMSCGCERCCQAYSRHGLDIDALREDAALAPGDPLFEQFLQAKADMISEAVGQLEEWFHSKGLEVGLDLFAPSLAAVVGQDFAALSAGADFVKPMMYRKTDAPAGIGFETRAMDPDFDDATMDKDFLLEELARAKESSLCPVYPGIEVNYREDIARTSPEYIIESLEAVREAGLPGAVLAWDIMLAPDSHLEAIGSIR